MKNISEGREHWGRITYHWFLRHLSRRYLHSGIRSNTCWFYWPRRLSIWYPRYVLESRLRLGIKRISDDWNLPRRRSLEFFPWSVFTRRETPVNVSIHLAYTGETYRYVKFRHLCINTITYLEPINRVAVLNELVTPLVSICYNGSRLLGCTADETIQNRYCRVDNIRIFGSILPDPCAVERLFDHIFIINMLIPFQQVSYRPLSRLRHLPCQGVPSNLSRIQWCPCQEICVRGYTWASNRSISGAERPT